MTKLKWEMVEMLKKIGVKFAINEAARKNITRGEEIGYFESSTCYHDIEVHLYKIKNGYEYILQIYYADFGSHENETEEYYSILAK